MWLRTDCLCRGFYRCQLGLLGRCEDMLWFEDGFGHRDFLHPLAIEGFCVEGLRDYQFLQTSRDSFNWLQFYKF